MLCFTSSVVGPLRPKGRKANPSPNSPVDFPDAALQGCACCPTGSQCPGIQNIIPSKTTVRTHDVAQTKKPKPLQTQAGKGPYGIVVDPHVNQRWDLCQRGKIGNPVMHELEPFQLVKALHRKDRNICSAASTSCADSGRRRTPRARRYPPRTCLPITNRRRA